MPSPRPPTAQLTDELFVVSTHGLWLLDRALPMCASAQSLASNGAGEKFLASLRDIHSSEGKFKRVPLLFSKL